MQDAARAACVSHAFKRSWRCYPNLAFNTKALGVDERSCGKDEIVRNFTSKVDNILNNHSCIAIKTLEIVFRYYDDKVCNLDSWLQTAITPGIEKLTVQLSTKSRKHYNFPCSLYLSRLELLNVNITGDQLGSLLHNAVALQRMKLNGCDYIICLKIPFHLQQLKYLEVFHCSSLRVIEIEAPNFSNFQFRGLRQVQLSLGVALQFKKFDMSFPGVVSYTCANLLSNLRYIEALSLCSWHEGESSGTSASGCHINAMIFSPTYNYCSLISLFDASPSLETLVLNPPFQKKNDSLKTVTIIGFSSAKSVVELTCHIIENTTSLQCLTLDTTTGQPWHSCLTNHTGKCVRLHVDFLVEVGKGLLAIRTYVEPKVPSGVKLNVVEPCRRCHDLEPMS
ncbi:hypothetical protein ZWY2020_036040 [Hordeum vulgare]|nr:hypothetical protein ZWY2020_036040 [Hordeum vulgare]